MSNSRVTVGITVTVNGEIFKPMVIFNFKGSPMG